MVIKGHHPLQSESQSSDARHNCSLPYRADMQVGQAPSWIPVATALAGVIVGTLLNWWQNNHRWKREGERERERLADERTHAEHLHWRDERLAVYGKLVMNLWEWHRWLVQATETHRSQQSLSSLQRAKANAARAATVESYAPASLLGTDLARKEFGEAMTQMDRYHLAIVEEEVGGDPRPVAAILERVEKSVRVELGLVHDVVLSDPSQPSTII